MSRACGSWLDDICCYMKDKCVRQNHPLENVNACHVKKQLKSLGNNKQLKCTCSCTDKFRGYAVLVHTAFSSHVILLLTLNCSHLLDMNNVACKCIHCFCAKCNTLLVEVVHVLSVLWIVHDLTIIFTLQNMKYTTSIII